MCARARACVCVCVCVCVCACLSDCVSVCVGVSTSARVCGVCISYSVSKPEPDNKPYLFIQRPRVIVYRYQMLSSTSH